MSSESLLAFFLEVSTSVNSLSSETLPLLDLEEGAAGISILSSLILVSRGDINAVSYTHLTLPTNREV